MAVCRVVRRKGNLRWTSKSNPKNRESREKRRKVKQLLLPVQWNLIVVYNLVDMETLSMAKPCSLNIVKDVYSIAVNAKQNIC